MRTCARKLTLVSFLVGSSFAYHGVALAQRCADVSPEKPGGDRDAVLRAARDCTLQREHAKAQALYRILLARNALDDEARLASARIDAWEGRWNEAGGAYREVLARHPHDVDARSALFDLLLWQRRWDEALELVDAGLDHAPRAPALLMRRAKLQHWLGDETEAVKNAAVAEIAAPLEPEVEVMGYRLFLGEARLFARIDQFPGGYPNQYQAGVLARQRSHRLEFSAGSQLLQRSGGAGERVVDGRYFAGVLYHPSVGAEAGLSLGFGSPARFVPKYEAKFSFLAPISRRFTGYFAYAAWLYGSDKVVHIFAPAVGFALRDDLEIDFRWWTSWVVLSPPPGARPPVQEGEMVHSAGLHLTYHATARIDVGAGYTYGVVLDQIPAVYQLLSLRSHVVTSFADWIVSSAFGVRPLLAIERRRTENQPPILIVSTEVAAYTRW